MMRRQMKLAAVLVVVVLALTGFTTSTSGGKGSKSKGSSSSGGGCSNSKKSNSGYRHTDYDDDDYDDNASGSSGSSYGTPTPTASDGPAVRVIRCAQPRKGKRKAVTASVVELRSKDTGSHTYEVDVTFYDARGNTVDTAETTTTLDAGDVRNLTVRMESPRRVSEVKRCEVTAQLL
ncbi:FxLYD domain-containing protein [Streptomyces microflavus]|uniref:FxLYD domain-containing protein n=1 Tax=Streptomyces microflavus TaxID=1919 RepID=UPI0029A78C85|nr:FxLYD domain-containing protein [Streptomyces microflavus]MDX2407024.1 FxLYD domain-containing protein [Streptomyces microflavus]